MSKEPLLFLCHRIPYPPNKGDKIRSFNILKMLNERFDVYVGCFIDDPYDKRYQSTLEEYCVSANVINQNKQLAKLKGLTSLLTGKPITLPYYFDSKMQQWVDKIVAQYGITKAFVYSSSMAQYCQGKAYLDMLRVIDFVDVDSDKWRQYALKKQGISRWIYQREHRLLSAVENQICQQFDHSLFVSPDEAALFAQTQHTDNAVKVHGILNGVDVDYFHPMQKFATESLVPSVPFISFTGAMDYWANIDAVMWFAEKVWPQIIAQCPEAKFVIAGGNPSSEVKSLAKKKGIIVTGRVNDMRPFIAQAACVVAPLQIARGIQNKVLEAMALDKPVVCTSMAMEGINAPSSTHVHIEDNAQHTAQLCIDYLHKPISEPVGNRAWVLTHFTWQQTLLPLAAFYQEKQGEQV